VLCLCTQLCIGKPEEFAALAKAMTITGVRKRRRVCTTSFCNETDRLTSQARSKHETRSKSKHDVYSSFAGIKPDFITIDGAEGGTGAAPPEFSNSVGFPMIDGLTIANNMLIGAGVRDDIKIICSG
jgi:hypothetical protein